MAARDRWARRALVLWLLAGAALGGARGAAGEADHLQIAALARRANAAVRIDATLSSGWEPSRWGARVQAVIHRASHGSVRLRLPRRAVIEIRGVGAAGALPPPGSRIEVLAKLRMRQRRLLLVASSPRLIDVTSPPRGLAALRARLAASLFEAAGTNVRRIRAAEFAAALALGRRDLIPAERRERWRRSGLAHLLAVSGLHVGVAAGLVWLVALLLGA
ncbi:MAG: hypothetical protein GXP48_04420, partial [Acidobacteria bacterium]|nr:hypothetical protein [Acidobacteriota bacterium]